MNIMHIKYAVEIADTRSISRAAENLYTSQPNLSRAIKDLEQDLSITIFKRTSKGISVTPEGEQFLEYAREIVSRVEKIERIYKTVRDDSCKLSMCVPRANYIACAFSDLCKDLELSGESEIKYRESGSKDTILNIAREEFDLGIVRYKSTFEKYFNAIFEEKGLESRVLTEFERVIAMSKDSPLASLDVVTPEDLEALVEIVSEDPSSLPYKPSPAQNETYTTSKAGMIIVNDRAMQLCLMEKMPNAYIRTSPIPSEVLDRYNLTPRPCESGNEVYRDVLIYRKKYRLTVYDNEMIKRIIDQKCKSLD